MLLAGVLVGAAGAESRDCPADCNGDRQVSIDELTLSVGIALGAAPIDACRAADGNGDGRVAIDELIGAVAAALSGCPTPPTATPDTLPDPTATGTQTGTPNATPRPNFIVIQLDDTRPDGIDRMAAVRARLFGEGVRFSNAFVPLPLCAPSRASILTGSYSLRHGTHRLTVPMGGTRTFRESGADQQTIAVWLRAAGYATGLFGKYLNAYKVEEDQGPGGGFYVPPGWSRWRAFVIEHYGGRDGVEYELVDEEGGRTAYVEKDDAQYSTHVLASELRRFIADATAEGAPFFALWTPYASHIDGPTLQPIPAAEYLDTLSPFPPWRPPSWNEHDRTDKPRWLQALDPPPAALVFTDQARQRAYEALFSVDDEIGLLLDQLEQLGIDDHTLVLLTSDNGVGWSEHALDGGWRKECPYEECLRVPMIVRYPRGHAGVPREADTPVLNIDVPVTIADLAGIAPPVPVDGVSFRATLDGDVSPLRGDFLLEHWGDVQMVLTFRAQPLDGDRVHVFFGGWPKQLLAFEFDANASTTPGSIAVPIESNAPATYLGLATLVGAHVPFAEPHRVGSQVVIIDRSPTLLGLYWMEEVDQSDAFELGYPIPQYFGVRDVANGFTYVEHESGEIELYDLTVDPWQLENKAGDATYGRTLAQLAVRTRELRDAARRAPSARTP